VILPIRERGEELQEVVPERRDRDALVVACVEAIAQLADRARRVAHDGAVRWDGDPGLLGQDPREVLLEGQRDSQEAVVVGRLRPLPEAVDIPDLSAVEDRVAREDDAQAIDLDEVAHRAVGVTRRVDRADTRGPLPDSLAALERAFDSHRPRGHEMVRMDVVDVPPALQIVSVRLDRIEARALRRRDDEPRAGENRRAAGLIAMVMREEDPIDARDAEARQDLRDAAIAAIDEERLRAIADDPDVDGAPVDDEMLAEGQDLVAGIRAAHERRRSGEPEETVAERCLGYHGAIVGCRPAPGKGPAS